MLPRSTEVQPLFNDLFLREHPPLTSARREHKALRLGQVQLLCLLHWHFSSNDHENRLSRSLFDALASAGVMMPHYTVKILDRVRARQTLLRWATHTTVVLCTASDARSSVAQDRVESSGLVNSSLLKYSTAGGYGRNCAMNF